MIWQRLKYFSKDEKWGNPEKISPMLLLLLEKLREKLGKPFVVHCGYENKGHSSASRHYRGDAVDFHVKDMPFKEAVDKLLKALHEIKLLDQVSAVYVGLGIYPDWNTPGFHIDLRGYSARWGRIGADYVTFEKAYHHATERGSK